MIKRTLLLWGSLACLSACLEPFPVYDDYRLADMSVQNLRPDVSPMECIGRSDYVFGEACNLMGVTDVCGVWSCRNGIQSCVPEGDAPASSPVEIPCNQTDDDCDLAVDEDLQKDEDCETSVNGEAVLGTWQCAPPASVPPQMPYVCLCCEAGSPACPEDQACRSKPVECEPVPEVCNGIDDDCNGEIDDGPFAPCIYDLGGCFINGEIRCEAGRSTCELLTAAVTNCTCIPPVIDGGTHYLSCAVPYSWTEADQLCGSLSSTYEQSPDRLRPGRLLEIESGTEFVRLNERLHDQSLTDLKTWLNFRYGEMINNLDFEDWFAATFPPRAFNNFLDEPSFDDGFICLSMDDDDDHEWSFDSCDESNVGVVCEFCPTENVDADNDGHFACKSDCDDNNKFAHWGADELCYNGIDDDCDARIDEGTDDVGCPCVVRRIGNRIYTFCDDFDDELSWSDARDRCAQRNMHLAVFETDAEFREAARIAQGLADDQQFWIGLRQPNRGNDTEGDQADSMRIWQWLKIEQTYPRNGDFWLDGHADAHDRDDRDCAYLRTRNQRPHVRADRCTTGHRYICENPIPVL